MYKHYFWDFDGMLFDTYPHSTVCFIKALQESRGITYPYNEVYDKLKITYGEAYDYFKVTDKEKQIFKKYSDDIEFKPCGYPYPPIEKILKTIVEVGGKNYIYTNRNELTITYLKKYNLDKYFTDYILAGMFPYKPDPTALNFMVEKYNLDKKECLVIGDRSLDVDGAYNAGIDGVLYDVDSRVFKHHATYVIKRLSQLYNFIDMKGRVKNNYHTHTSRCGHAIGEDEQYVQMAIKAGYDTLGFTDHLMIPDVKRNYQYFNDIRILKEKYKDQIVIKVGLECEYYTAYLDMYRKFLKDGDVDYLIFGNHGILNDGSLSRENETSFITKFEDPSILDLYYKTMEQAVESGLFKYICHPDCFLKGWGKWDEAAICLTHKIAKLLANKNVYAELSCSGVRSRKKVEYEGELIPAYPFKEFYKILKEYNIKFVIGLDAHSPSQLDDEALQYVLNLAQELDLVIIQELNDL